MAKLVVKAPGEPEMKLELPPGLHQLGRSPAAHFQINHPSVSGCHCQIAVLPEGATIRDLGSTNGTWMDGQRIEEKPLLPGQRVRLGEVDAVFEPEAAAPAPTVRLATVPTAAVVAQQAPPPARTMPTPSAPDRNFYQSIPSAFIYPLKHMGAPPLAIGSVLFLAFNVLPRLERVVAALFVSGGYGRGPDLFFRAAFGGGFFGIGTIFNALCTGYIFLFMQSIIAASANGEERMPMYPTFESWWEDGAEPYLRLVAILACCLAPAILSRAYLGPDAHWLTLFLGFLGFAYFSMALLAVSLCDSIVAMAPQVVIPSIWRVPGEYAVYCVVFFLLTFASFYSLEWVMELPIRYPIYQLLLVEFFFLYISAVEMRLLGLIYHTGRERLAWKA